VIDTSEALAAFLPELDSATRVAIDTEADSLHCYFEKLCLIQLSLPGCDALIDPLASFSLEPLFEALAKREQVLHGMDYDLRLLRRVGFPDSDSIFDTMIAARLIGEPEFSLAALLQKYFSVTLAKGSQKANWARRPLSLLMEEYAINDTHYLLDLADILAGKLRELERWEWFQQSCARAMESTKTDRDRDVENAWRITGSSDLRGRAAAVLRALWRWRDTEARAVDRPPFHILQNEKLIEAAVQLDAGERVSLPHLSSSRARRFSEAAQFGLNSAPEEWPQPVRKARGRLTREQEIMVQNLKTRRDAAAVKLQIDSSLIAPKATLEAIAADQATWEKKLLPWQRDLLAPAP
jgi:ribonuclease D